MDVRELKNFLELKMDEAKAGQVLKTYSHWLAAVFEAGEYVTSNPKDTGPLKSLELIGMVELGESGGRVKARLTKEGKGLYFDFKKRGYY